MKNGFIKWVLGVVILVQTPITASVYQRESDFGAGYADWFTWLHAYLFALVFEVSAFAFLQRGRVWTSGFFALVTLGFDLIFAYPNDPFFEAIRPILKAVSIPAAIVFYSHEVYQMRREAQERAEQEALEQELVAQKEAVAPSEPQTDVAQMAARIVEQMPPGTLSATVFQPRPSRPVRVAVPDERTCQQCGRDFTTVSSKARFCGDACRAKFNRNRKKEEAFA